MPKKIINKAVKAGSKSKVASSRGVAKKAVTPVAKGSTKTVSKSASKAVSKITSKSASKTEKKATSNPSVTLVLSPESVGFIERTMSDGTVITDEYISIRAYFISEERQRLGLSGDALSDWLKAEQELRG